MGKKMPINRVFAEVMLRFDSPEGVNIWSPALALLAPPPLTWESSKIHEILKCPSLLPPSFLPNESNVDLTVTRGKFSK